MDGYWNEATLEWLKNPGKPFINWVYDENTQQWMPPVEYPNDGDYYMWNQETSEWNFVSSNQPYPSWTWNTETKVWEAPTPKPDSDTFPSISYVWNEETLTWEEQ
jgi:hypothetical protein